MGRNLFIGPPGGLWEIDRAAKSFDRAADLGVSEFQSIGGRVTVMRRPNAVRRVKLSWDALEPAKAKILDRLARRTDGNGPLALIDPTTANMLDARAATGKGDRGAAGLGQWFVSGVGGSLIETSPGVFSVKADDAVNATVGWNAPRWYGFPVAPGMRVSFRAPSAIAALAARSVQLDFKDVAGVLISSVNAAAAYVAGTVPAGAAFVTPTARPGVAGTYSLGGACLSYDDGAAAGIPGEGCPPMVITGYTDSPTKPYPYRSVSIDLVEVSSAAV
ncbi:hypothetical protein ACFQLX_02680 [Streptomyces polyrhachis]|uniref:Uncharacterized protein n=1 Tax=Streptomyces polyrhachis TaxID=1282885 RepID=A0ABW2GC05_9ACTN